MKSRPERQGAADAKSSRRKSNLHWPNGQGPHTTSAVQSILNRTKHVEQSYKSCQGVLSLKRKYGKERLEKACKRLAGCSSITYTTIRNVLEKNLDQVYGQETVSNVPQNDYVRGAEAFMNI